MGEVALGGPEMPSLGVDPDLARQVYSLLLAPGLWLHRRVESLILLDERRTLRRVSVDLTIPPRYPIDETGEAVLPIALLRKQPLVKFDLTAEHGEAIALLTTEQNGRLSTAALLQLAYAERPDLRVSWLDEYVAVLVKASTTRERTLAKSRLFDERTEVGRHLANRGEFVALANDLGQFFVAYARVQGVEGTRRILKFSYEVPMLRESQGLRALLGVRPHRFTSGPLAVGHSASYHFEVAAPEGTEISYAVLLSDDGRAQRVHGAGDMPRQTAHMYLAPADRGTRGVAYFAIRARRPGLLRAALVAAFVGALVILLIRLRLSQFEAASVGSGSHAGSDAVAALLASFPALFATYVARPGAHAIVAEVTIGPRALLFLSGFVSFLSALTLFAGFSKSALDTIWTTAVVVEWLVFACLAAASVLPRPVAS